MHRRYLIWDVVFICLTIIYLISNRYIHYPREMRIIFSTLIVVMSILRVIVWFKAKK